MNSPGNYCFANHPKGFKVFLPPGEISPSDEYQEGDPYSVDKSSAFHQRRFRCTIALASIAANQCGKSFRFLDIGCGAGHLTEALRAEFPSGEASGLDYSVSAIVQAVEVYPQVDFVVGSAYSLPYCPGYFDLAICNNIWEHVPDPVRMLESIRQVLKPGGFLIISTPSRYRFENMLRLIQGKPVEFGSKLHVTEYSVGQVREQLQFGQFEVTKCYSEPIRRRQSSVRKRLVYGIGFPLCRWFFSLYGRQHDLETTVFFLARKKS
jgi:SAM-dependent methyltransferase